MEDIFFPQACEPQISEALKELELQQNPTYFTEDDKKSARTNETQPWIPHRHILDYVPHLASIDVVMLRDCFTPTNQPADLLNKILERGKIGLVLMGPGRRVVKETKPSLIIVTTKDKYYAIEPDCRKELIFLLKLLQQPDLEIYMSDLLREAACLKSNYGLDLLEMKATINCASGSHIYMMSFMRHMSESCTAKYPMFARDKCYNTQLMVEEFEDLAEIWLDINKSRIRFDEEQLIHLKTRPLSVAAKNVIKKRCCLVETLNEVLEYYSEIEFDHASELTFNTLVICNEPIANSLEATMLGHDDVRGDDDDDDDDDDNEENTVQLMKMIGYCSNIGVGLGMQKYMIIPEPKSLADVEYETDSDSD